MSTNLVPKSSTKYFCEKCDYYTFRKSQYDRHLATDKHKLIVTKNFSVPNNVQVFKCICGKSYKYDSGYYRHKKTCEMLNAEAEQEKEKEKEEDKNVVLVENRVKRNVGNF